MQALVELMPLKKYTIVHFDKTGWPGCIKFTLRSTGYHRIGKKQYVRMVIKPSNSPTRDILIDPHNQFVLFKDWVTPDCEIIVGHYMANTKLLGEVKMGRTWSKYDPRYLKKAADSMPEDVMIWNIKEPKKEVFLDTSIVVN